jgi:hypothetical protein
MASFMLQLAAAVISESVGMTICVMVAGNVLLNVFLMKLFACHWALQKGPLMGAYLGQNP